MLIRAIALFLLMSISALAGAACQAPSASRQAAAQTSPRPDSQDARMSALRSLGDDEKAALLNAREAVWRAWFAGDERALRELLPPELITLDGDSDAFGTLDTNIKGALSFAKSGGKLRRIEFPRTEIQAYGNTAIIYTTYALESEMGGDVHKEAGRATEVFVRRGDRWLNTGWQLAPNR